MDELQDFVDGAWQASLATECLPLNNPASEETIASMPVGTVADVDRAVIGAAAAQRSWSALSLDERIDALRRLVDSLGPHIDELAELECREMGKPLALGRDAINGAIGFFRDAIGHARTYPFEQPLSIAGGGTSTVIRRPLGVTAVIVPWNYTAAGILVAIGPLLAAGNAVVVKPSEKAPLSAVGLFERANLLGGALSLVLGDGRTGAALAEHPEVRLVHFTGSVRSGQSVARATSTRLCRAVLELGGKDPVIVDADVDPVETAREVAVGAFLNTGQICTSMERIYVHADVAGDFLAALVEAAAGWTMGDGHDPQTKLGPLVDARQREHVHRHVLDAVSKGASVASGGAPPARRGWFYPATVLTDVRREMDVMRDETFGPVAPVQVVSSFEEGLAEACGTRFGLAATVYSNDPAHLAAARELPAGLIWINRWQGGASAARIYEPVRESGLGATGGHAAYDAATRPATVYELPVPVGAGR